MQTEAMAGNPAVVAITGGLGALGQALAVRFKQRGDHVIVLDQGHAANGPLQEVDLALNVDLNDTNSVRDAFEGIAKQFGKLDALVCVAGGFVYEMLSEASIDAWDRMYSMNLRTAVVACQAALPLLREGGAGSIVCIGADAVGRAGAGMGPYVASKSGVIELVRTLATETREHGVTANAVLPSILDTPANRQAMPDADVARWVSLDAIGSLILFLTSPQARQINGASIPIVNRC